MVLGTFTLLSNHHYHPSAGLFKHPSRLKHGANQRLTLLPLSQIPVNTILLSVGTDLLTHQPEIKPVLELEVHLEAYFPNLRLLQGNANPLWTIIPVL